MSRPPDMQALDADILEAHQISDGTALACLYGKAAKSFEHAGAEDAACFFYTQAYVFALENGHSDAERFALALRHYGRL